MTTLVRRTAVLAVAVLATACGEESTNPSPPPPPAAVASVTLTPGDLVIAAGSAQALTTTLRDAEGNALSGRVVAYNSDNPAAATVSAAGVVTGVSEGTATISATSEGKGATAQVIVQPAPVAAVQVAPLAVTMDLGTTTQLTVTLRDAQGGVLTGRPIEYVSSNPATASVSETGLVTGLAGGTAIISVSSEGKGADVLVQVHVPVVQVTIGVAPDTLEAFDQHQLVAILWDANGGILAPRPMEWTSSNPAVALVDPQTGKVTALDRGIVTITATREGHSGSTNIEVVIKYRSITAGTMHACDIASGGIAWCWGLNGVDGRIGLAQTGDGVHRSEPYRVPGNHKFVQLVSYSRFTCGLDTAGKAWCWGNNNWGSLGNGTSVSHSSTPTAVAGNLTFVELTTGADHACGRTNLLGATYCWGHNDWGQFGRGNTTSSNAPVVAAGGAVFLSIAAGSVGSCGVAVTGQAYCWGTNNFGQLGDGGQIAYGNVYKTTPQAVVQGGVQFNRITMGDYYTCALTAAGTGYCWGRNGGRFGNGATADASLPQAIAGGHTWKTLSAGFAHACGINAQDDIYCWGSNGNGQLGLVLQNGSISPVRAGGIIKGAEVAASDVGTGAASHTCAISRDRLTTWCWGRNDVGQLGNGQTTTSVAVNATPTIVVGQQPR